MAANDIKVVGGGGGVVRFRTDDRDTSSTGGTIKPGEPVKVGGAGNNFVILCADGDPEQNTDIFLGICAKESTETASADGRVDVQVAVGNQTLLRGKVTTTGNMDADSELLGILFDTIAFDYAAQAFTLDENDGASNWSTFGLQIVDGDVVNNTLVVRVLDNITRHQRAI